MLYPKMDLVYFLLVLISFQLVQDTQSDVISSAIDELKEWTDYFGLTEYHNLWTYYTNEDTQEECSESQHLLEKGKEDEQSVESRAENILEDDILTLTKELPQNTEYVDDNINRGVLPEIDNSGSNKSKVQEVPLTLESDQIQTNHKKTRNFGKDTENRLVENDGSEEMNEVIIYDDMVKIELSEETENTGYIHLVENVGDNTDKSDKTFSNSVDKEKAIQNNIPETQNENKLDNSLHQSEKNIPLKEDGSHPSTVPQTNLYVELPLADDEDDLNTLPQFSICNDDPSSEFCSQKDATLSSEIKKNTENLNLEKTITEYEQDLEDENSV